MGEVNDVLMDYLRDNTRFADLFNGTLFGGESVIRAEELFEGSEVSVEGLFREGTRKAAGEGLFREEQREISGRRGLRYVYGIAGVSGGWY